LESESVSKFGFDMSYIHPSPPRIPRRLDLPQRIRILGQPLLLERQRPLDPILGRAQQPNRPRIQQVVFLDRLSRVEQQAFSIRDTGHGRACGEVEGEGFGSWVDFGASGEDLVVQVADEGVCGCYG